jgi:hypothetical protein
VFEIQVIFASPAPPRRARRSASADSQSNDGSDRLSARGDSGANGRGGTVKRGTGQPAAAKSEPEAIPHGGKRGEAASTHG